jgi:CheY-like chemotaxis protein
MANMTPKSDDDKAASNEAATILVVEDDQISLKFIESMLEQAGYRIQTAQNGLLCLDKVAEVLPDLIIMDVVMPSMDGIEACKQLKANGDFRQIPVIFVTGNTDDQTLEAAFDAGASDYVRKPVRQVELLMRVRAALAQRRMLRQMAAEEKLKGILATAGGVCHELNQPLQYVLGLVQLMMMDIPPENEAYGHLASIRHSVEQMGAITRKLSEITHWRILKYAGGQDIIDIKKTFEDGVGEKKRAED